MTTTCTLHGLPLTTASGGCATCIKAPTECDYGTCRRRPTMKVTALVDGAAREARRVCEKHVGPTVVGYMAARVRGLTTAVDVLHEPADVKEAPGPLVRFTGQSRSRRLSWAEYDSLMGESTVHVEHARVLRGRRAEEVTRTATHEPTGHRFTVRARYAL